VSQPFNVVIAGAGIVGLSLAALLARADSGRRLNLRLVDAASKPRFDLADDIALRVSALAPGSVSVLQRVDAWSAVQAARACPYREMRVWDAAGTVDGPDTLRFDAAEHALPELGFIAENILVQKALIDVLDHLPITLDFDTRIDSMLACANGYELFLTDGQRVSADLVIGADGAQSFVREQAGIQVEGWSYAQKAFVTHVQPAKDHQYVAWQRFLRDGPLGLLPLADGRVSVVWSTTPDKAAAALDCSDDELQAMLTEASDGVLGELRPAAARAAFPLRAQFAQKYVKPGLALIGDAAHTVHPLAGQGANLGIADASVLADVILAAIGNDEFPGDLPVLRRFERSRKGANQLMLRFVDGLNRLFSVDLAPVTGLRSAGLRMFNRSGPIKRRVVREALGIGP